jgi:hypothetical protein
MMKILKARFRAQVELSPYNYSTEWNPDVMPGTSMEKHGQDLEIRADDGKLLIVIPWSNVASATPVESEAPAVPKAAAPKKPAAKPKSAAKKSSKKQPAKTAAGPPKPR